MSKRTLSPQDIIVREARDFLRRGGRLVLELYYHTKIHPKTGEVSHLFRGKETLPQGTKTVRFLGLVDERGNLTGLDEVGSRERKRIGSRGPIAGRIPVPHSQQKIVRRDREKKLAQSLETPVPIYRCLALARRHGTTVYSEEALHKFAKEILGQTLEAPFGRGKIVSSRVTAMGVEVDVEKEVVEEGFRRALEEVPRT